MKIAFVTHKYGGSGGGIEKVVYELAERFSGEHEVHVYTQEINAPNRSSVIFHTVPRFKKSWSVNLVFFFFVSGILIRKKSFDVVHLHAPCFFKKGIVTCHGIPRAGIKALEKKPALVREIPKRKTRRFRLMKEIYEYNFRKHNHKRVIAISSSIKQDLVSVCNTPDDSIVFIPNGADTEKFSSVSRRESRNFINKEFGFNDKNFIFFFAGNFFRRKGLDFLLIAFAGISDKNTRLIVCGNTGEENLWALDTAQELGISDRVVFAGQRSDIAKFYASSDAFVFPSIYEASALVIPEAQAAGLPVIASPTGGAADFIENGKNGFILSSADNIEELREKMILLVKDSDLCRQMGISAQKNAASYSWDNIAQKTLEIFKTEQ